MRLPPPIDQEVFYAALLLGAWTEAETAVVMLLWRTGMHSSTLCKQAFVLSNTIVDWRRNKPGQHKGPMLTAHLTKQEAKLVKRCLTAGDLPTTQRTLRWWLKRVGERAGYPECTPLTLRHSRAIYLLDGQMPINRVAALLGCSWTVLERHYAVIENARKVQR